MTAAATLTALHDAATQESDIRFVISLMQLYGEVLMLDAKLIRTINKI